MRILDDCVILSGSVFLALQVLTPLGLLAGSGGLVAENARLLPVQSLCQIGESPNDPEGFNVHRGTTVTITACGNLDEELKTPKAVRVTFRNTGQSELQAVIDFAQVTVQTGAGKAVRLSAVRANHAYGARLFWKQVDGSVSVSVGGGKQADWILVFAEASRGDTLHIDGATKLTID